MGECNYYFKARFANEGQAKTAQPRLAELLAEGEKAAAYWQGSRGSFGRGDPNRMPHTAETFWRIFYDRFPLTVRYLGELAGIDDWNNGLAGHLSLVDPLSPRRYQPGAILRRIDNLLLPEGSRTTTVTQRRVPSCAGSITSCCSSSTASGTARV